MAQKTCWQILVKSNGQDFVLFFSKEVQTRVWNMLRKTSTTELHPSFNRLFNKDKNQSLSESALRNKIESMDSHSPSKREKSIYKEEHCDYKSLSEQKCFKLIEQNNDVYHSQPYAVSWSPNFRSLPTYRPWNFTQDWENDSSL